MSAALATAPIEFLDAIGLEELTRSVTLQIRADRKYVVPREVVDELIDHLRPQALVLEIDGIREFEYETTYFDTPDLALYRAAAASRPRRFKVRTRTYLDSKLSMLEVKTKDPHGLTVKHRQEHPYERRDELTTYGRDFISSVVCDTELIGRLDEVMTNRFRRRTLQVADSESRLTIDSGFRCWEAGGGFAELPDHLIVETKTEGKPGIADRFLWSTGHRPQRFSKYGVGLAVARGGLPDNKWKRTIRRYFA